MGFDNRIRVVPLGGLEQIGMNITAFCYGESIIVVDCGLAFPEDDLPMSSAAVRRWKTSPYLHPTQFMHPTTVSCSVKTGAR